MESQSDPEQAAELLEEDLISRDRDKALISDLQAHNTALKAERDLLKESQRPSHIIVLIDGDGVIFEIDRIAQGHVGGMQAGKDLSAGLESHFGSTPHRPLLVYIFLNTWGLRYKLGKLGRSDAQRNLYGFVVGFNEAATGFMMVDVGRNKEAADGKIKVLLEKEICSPQTEFLVFGGCHDSGYISELNTHITRGLGHKLRLLQAYDEPPVYVIGALKLPIIQIPGLFVPEKLPETGSTPWVSPAPNSGLSLPPVDDDTLPPSLSPLPPMGSPKTSPKVPSSRRTSFADHRRNGSSGSGARFNNSGSTHNSPASGSLLLQPSSVPRDIDPSRELWNQDPRLCIFHYLAHVGCKGKFCRDSHDYILNDEQLAAFREHFLAIPCKSINDNKKCSNGKRCVFGHKCPALGNCALLQEGKCSFKGDGMHTQ
ncbi:hypothetical protein DFP72DRAFT_881502 [Ephemerocybe angulata]|uniref:DUF7923 domain-containing protein n=1 Tax=Ephemerocybe angulata TaxID=980116 RepID=A0A8H6I8D3_9AGAR|nr:hypothetical protein DFP72DRAFT_881502 [Tulosesus angulatus]